ncbi:hypothetical protein ABLA30_05230 [Xenorhabdus nematophila]|uniref:Uncharacterized protein n=1 Tax=Xenorhabdus nematophila (strain ATCC 19061 / DSM 3370 / CCUG 14189 / LMG 1036 / NCIMB 9965 / AN6) TaxID=406817 RepID=D3VKN3_XENNA|nr:hypothetical protein [Xenorhabdus nematophila]CBJ91141.1 hypothetical protein XNC1_3087 [Xenorhabdus nematophila ATCC 19061]
MKKLTTANELLKSDLDTYFARRRKWWKNTRTKPYQRAFKTIKSRRDKVLRQIIKCDLAAGILILRG